MLPTAGAPQEEQTSPLDIKGQIKVERQNRGCSKYRCFKYLSEEMNHFLNKPLAHTEEGQSTKLIEHRPLY